MDVLTSPYIDRFRFPDFPRVMALSSSIKASILGSQIGGYCFLPLTFLGDTYEHFMGYNQFDFGI